MVLRATSPESRRGSNARKPTGARQHEADFDTGNWRGSVDGAGSTHVAEACTRAVYFGQEGQTVTGRTMDWAVSDIDTNMWLYPRGLERNSNTATPLIWTSKYGSVVTTIYEGAAADGMNEAGLVANMLYLAEVQVSAREPKATRGPRCRSRHGCSMCWTTTPPPPRRSRACARKSSASCPIVAPTGEPGTVHLSISDASGDSAIFEFIDGKLVIHHGREYQIMTNSPTYRPAAGLAAYWKNIGGSVMLPGTNRAADRFARMSYYINEATQTADPRRAVATVFSVMRNVSVPIGIKVPGQAEHRRHAVADRQRPEEQGLLLSGHQQPQHPVGEPGRAGFQRRLGPAQTAARRQPGPRRRPDRQLPAGRAVQVPVAQRVSGSVVRNASRVCLRKRLSCNLICNATWTW